MFSDLKPGGSFLITAGLIELSTISPQTLSLSLRPSPHPLLSTSISFLPSAAVQLRRQMSEQFSQVAAGTLRRLCARSSSVQMQPFTGVHSWISAPTHPLAGP